MRKDFVRDRNGKVEHSYENVEKMNFFEWLYYLIFTWNVLGNSIKEVWENLKECIEPFKSILFELICLVFLPISLPLAFIKVKYEIKKF